MPYIQSLSRSALRTVAILTATLLLALIPILTHAEANVAGEEIFISSDDTLKSAPTDSGSNSPLAEGSNTPADTSGVPNSDLWQRIKDGYAIPDSQSGLIAQHENWYSSRPDYVKRMVERSQKYLFHIVEEVQKRGMPTEIALLPMVESAYNPQAYSRSRASGIWQFIPSTGKDFGLKQNWWVDNRKNVTAATDAALNYLQKLHAMFGAWDLALAAYNAGEGTVKRAIERNRRLGLPTNYESLKLPPETKNYVPKLQAIKNLITNPGNYGLTIRSISNNAYFSKVTAPSQIDAGLAAKLAGISNEEFMALNPGYNRPVLAGDNNNHELLLPISAVDTFNNNLAAYNKPLVSWQTYNAKRGERVDSIANRFGINVSQLRDVNDLPAQKKIKKSETLLVPNGNKIDLNGLNITPAQTTEPQPENSATTVFSSDFNIDQNTTDPDTDNSASTGKKNTSKKQAYNKRVAVKHRTYVVKQGDTLDEIAQKFNVETAEIKQSNKNINPRRIKPGSKLIIPARSTSR